jgi:arylsulfatase A-like enzyme
MAVLAAVSLWNPAVGWSFVSATSPATGIVIGTLVLVTTAMALRAVTSKSTGLRFAGSAAAVGVPLLALSYASFPLGGMNDIRPEWPRAVVLVTIDTLRADHLGAYGYSRDESPAIDTFAKESVVFERAYAPMPTTDPSHVAILTGLLPRTTGVTKNGLSITLPDVSSLASWFLERGYRTGAVTSRAHLDPDALALPGFQTKSVPDHATPATEAYRRATHWVEQHGDRPFFLWVHFWDPHSPYAPPIDEAFRYTDKRGLSFVHGIAPYVERSRPLTPEEIEYATALYDAEIRHADQWVGRFLAETQSRVGAEDVLTIPTSDHGESLGELDRDMQYAFDHGKVLVGHELHLPLIVNWPGRLDAGKRVAAPVPTAGITPTVTSLLGDELAGDVDDFTGLLLDDVAVAPGPLLVERRSFAEPAQLEFLAAPELGIVDGRWLYVENPERGRYIEDLEPGAPMPATTPAALAARLSESLRALSRELTPANVDDTMDADKLEKLRALG